MAVMGKISCWEVIRCDPDNKCPVRGLYGKRCWEVMQEVDGFQCECNICEDCLVYLTLNGSQFYNEKKLTKILKQRFRFHNKSDYAGPVKSMIRFK